MLFIVKILLELSSQLNYDKVWGNLNVTEVKENGYGQILIPSDSNSKH